MPVIDHISADIMQPVDLSPGLVYRAEGNANMVVAIQGTGLVLRYVKYLKYRNYMYSNLPSQASKEQEW